MSGQPGDRDKAKLGYLAAAFAAGLLIISGGGFWLLIVKGEAIRHRGEFMSLGDTLTILIPLALAGITLLRVATKLLPPR
ncbi:hypothetical protein P1X14_21750 [Sphingomonas sp. AOB5]|uniref:hypothetical protein n=1 Tax=Sphingomonas sp. AOB5 TaxID=3034017 RepID=UPI0023F6BF90|nr:hypothetical protein [Sphingomonas sp. AOB5]MDF7777895.1 hypothetical protein [Sphingomonas sp. AOB5]